MDELYTCLNCGRRYRADKLADCPGCSHEPGTSQARPLPWSSDQAQSQSQIDNSQYLEALILAQNRTTHAVRALAVFFFTWLKVSIFGALAFFFGMWIDQSFDSAVFGQFLIIVGVLTNVVGFFIALNDGLDELNRSKP